MKIELIPIPVTDVDRAKAFYVEKLGWHADFDEVVHAGLRFVQLTPPGSACSICIGVGITEMKPGSIQGNTIVIENAAEAHKELKAKGVEVSDVKDEGWGVFVYFKDPDGNGWSLQELPKKKEA